jgi:hypothetical protein
VYDEDWHYEEADSYRGGGGYAQEPQDSYTETKSYYSAPKQEVYTDYDSDWHYEAPKKKKKHHDTHVYVDAPSYNSYSETRYEPGRYNEYREYREKPRENYRHAQSEEADSGYAGFFVLLFIFVIIVLILASNKNRDGNAVNNQAETELQRL